ncbi:MAG: hypothetical protein JWQ01_4888 [Massilia sp.]|nr:hypothetical protein [Massilia sp.]
MTVTANIIAAITAKLVAAGLTVREDTEALYSFENFPCIVIDCGDEYPVQTFAGGVTDWNLTVTLCIGADGPVPKLAPEPTRATAHTAMYADRTLGGVVLDLIVGQITRSIDADNPAAGITQAIYQVKYRSPESIA